MMARSVSNSRFSIMTQCITTNVIAHTILLCVSVYVTIANMVNCVMTYEEALSDAGSPFLLRKKLESNELYKLSRGAYSKIKHPDPLVLAHVLYPESVQISIAFQFLP